MPTNEERRLVAKELRYTASHSLDGYSFQRSVEGTVFGTIGDRPWRVTLTRLADLIEPEPVCIANVTFTDEQVEKIKSDVMEELEQPERTCRMNKKESKHVLSGWWECSECGIVYPPCNEEIALWALKYCPHCGAKVVE